MSHVQPVASARVRSSALFTAAGIAVAANHALALNDPSTTYAVPLAGAVAAQDTTSQYYAKVRVVTEASSANPASNNIQSAAPAPPVNPPPAPANWTWSIGHKASKVENGSAQNVVVTLNGVHVIAPHGEPPNTLLPIETKAKNFNNGAAETRKMLFKVKDHPGAEPPHRDLYGMNATTTFTDEFSVGKIRSDVEIMAFHNETDKDLKKNYDRLANELATVMWTPDGGSSMDYSAPTGRLVFHLRGVTVLDTVGGRSGGIDPALAAEPLLNAQGTLVFASVDPTPNDDGLFLAHDGMLRVATPDGLYTLELQVGTLAIGAAPSPTGLQALGFVDSLEAADDTESHFRMSFFDVFYGLNVAGHNLPDADRRAVILTASSGRDSLTLAQATRNFTRSVFAHPATVTLSGSSPLEVDCHADFNGDGFVDFFDFDDFIQCFEGLPCPPGRDADFNHDGFIDFFDLDDFIADFERGC